MMKVIITGSSGQLGKYLINNSPAYLKNEIKIYALTSSDFNLLRPTECLKKIKEIKPKWFINCAAYTNVDKAELESEKSIFINGLALQEISKALKNINCNLIQISSDYVFDGSNNSPYKINNKRNPLNKYGEGKAIGEKIIEDILFPFNNSKIIRTSWLMSSKGNNFVKTILNLHKSKKELKVISDQVGSFTSAKILSEFIWEIIIQQENGIKTPQILHCTNSGICSWFDIAVAIGEFAKRYSLVKNTSKVIPIGSQDLFREAKRPAYSVLESLSSWESISKDPIYWRTSLEEIIKEFSQERNNIVR